jgi:hypothetical protein
MPSFLVNLGITIGAAYALLDRSQVGSLAKMLGYGLGRSVGILRNYRQNAEKLVRANPEGQKGVMGTMRELDAVAREVRMAVWMARPGAMMRVGPMGGMTITPPQQSINAVPSLSQPSIPAGAVTPMGRADHNLSSSKADAFQEDESLPEGGSDILVSSWRNGTERTRVLKRV